MWLYPLRIKGGGVLVGVMTMYGLVGAIEFPTWETFEGFFRDLGEWREQELERMQGAKIPDVFLSAFREDEDREG